MKGIPRKEPFVQDQDHTPPLGTGISSVGRAYVVVLMTEDKRKKRRVWRCDVDRIVRMERGGRCLCFSSVFLGEGGNLERRMVVGEIK
jgi:hypothetical protein